MIQRKIIIFSLSRCTVEILEYKIRKKFLFDFGKIAIVGVKFERAILALVTLFTSVTWRLNI